MSLVNETLRPETETRPRRLTSFSPRRDRDRDLPTFLRDRDETETLGKCVSRPSRDRDRDYIPGNMNIDFRVILSQELASSRTKVLLAKNVWDTPLSLAFSIGPWLTSPEKDIKWSICQNSRRHWENESKSKHTEVVRSKAISWLRRTSLSEMNADAPR